MKKLILLIILLPLIFCNTYANSNIPDNKILSKILNKHNLSICDYLDNDDIIVRDIRAFTFSNKDKMNEELMLSIKLSCLKKDCPYLSLKRLENPVYNNLLSDFYKNNEEYIFNSIISNNFDIMGLNNINDILGIYDIPESVVAHNNAIADIMGEIFVTESSLGIEYCDLYYCRMIFREEGEYFINIEKDKNNVTINGKIFELNNDIVISDGVTYISVSDLYKIFDKDTFGIKKDYFDCDIINVKNKYYVSLRIATNKIFGENYEIIYNSDTKNIAIVSDIM